MSSVGSKSLHASVGASCSIICQLLLNLDEFFCLLIRVFLKVGESTSFVSFWFQGCNLLLRFSRSKYLIVLPTQRLQPLHVLRLRLGGLY